MSRERIRVLHVITRLDRGGSAENTLLTVARMDVERFASSLAVGPTLEGSGSTEKQARANGVEFIDLPHLVRAIRLLDDLLAIGELWRLMRRGKYQVVHTHTSKGGLLGRIAARLAGVPVVVHTPHGHVFYGYYGRALTRLFIWLERWAVGFTDRLVALTRREVEEYETFGVAPGKKCAVIHSGIDFAPFASIEEAREEIRAELGIPQDGLVIGTVGRLTAIKGQADLVTAFARVRERVEGAYLLLIGEGEEHAMLQELARELGVDDRVLFAGWREDVHRALRGMDIFALPSYNEGMGKALVEGMYAGLPVVATAVGGVPELVEPGRNGLLVEPGCPGQLAAALLELAENEEKRKAWGTAAGERAAAFSVESMIGKIEELYEELLEEKGIALPGCA
jgi:glycosyltransferase involved in cell wall biosynthesis